MATRNLHRDGLLFLLVVLLGAVDAAHAQYSASAALKNIETKLSIVGMTSSLQYMRECGFNNSLLKSLSTTKTTLLVPVNSAWGKLDLIALSYLRKNPTKMWQVFAYNMLAGYYTPNVLAAIPYNSQISTGLGGSMMVKRFPTQAVKLGRPDGSFGTYVKMNVYVDSQVVIYGVDSVLMPPKFS